MEFQGSSSGKHGIETYKNCYIFYMFKQTFLEIKR